MSSDKQVGFVNVWGRTETVIRFVLTMYFRISRSHTEDINDWDPMVREYYELDCDDKDEIILYRDENQFLDYDNVQRNINTFSAEISYALDLHMKDFDDFT